MFGCFVCHCCSLTDKVAGYAVRLNTEQSLGRNQRREACRSKWSYDELTAEASHHLVSLELSPFPTYPCSHIRRERTGEDSRKSDLAETTKPSAQSPSKDDHRNHSTTYHRLRIALGTLLGCSRQQWPLSATGGASCRLPIVHTGKTSNSRRMTKWKDSTYQFLCQPPSHQARWWKQGLLLDHRHRHHPPQPSSAHRLHTS